MNTHEYQAKEILKKYGIPIPQFAVVSSEEELKRVIPTLPFDKAVIKIQVHAGGRGKAGGVKFAKNKEEMLEIGKKLLGMKIVNNQTGPEGVVAHQILISNPVDIEKEYYLSLVIDRQNGCASLIASPEGGMDIEEVAEKHPEKILTLLLRTDGIIKPYQLLRLTKFMGWQGDLAKQGAQIAVGLAKAFLDTDASLLEINPLVKTPDNKLWAVDAKLSIDENALYRQPEIAKFYDPTQLPKQEAQAKQYDLAYIALDGNIGCMVNGAGLAMATMDIINHYGGKPANFLDVGGGASEDKVAEGFKLILADPKVKAILVNIFGGIMDCGVLAAGIISAAKELQVKVPLVVRMEGTNVDIGKKLLAESKLNIIIADGLDDAAQKVMKKEHKRNGNSH